ncbi:hypothetical protein HAX54_020958 [Datura stramonium]|uniref:Uncharacterized protein n=1 Tax=Datura stramonium TaxID=4076 RepID=A0ABS8USM9_DATST|nr:hypothetical protein [Datura stramonium]
MASASGILMGNDSNEWYTRRKWFQQELILVLAVLEFSTETCRFLEFRSHLRLFLSSVKKSLHLRNWGDLGMFTHAMGFLHPYGRNGRGFLHLQAHINEGHAASAKLDTRVGFHLYNAFLTTVTLQM